MKKTWLVVTIIGLVLFVGGVGVIIFSFSQAGSEENSLAFDRKVTAQITNTRIAESSTGHRKKKNGTGYTDGHTTYTYYVEFLVSDGGYTVENAVSASEYEEYKQLEKNKDMDFNVYRNPDGAEFLSLKDLEGATAEYRSGGHVTKDIAIRMIASIAAAVIGFGVLGTGLKMKGRNRY